MHWVSLTSSQIFMAQEPSGEEWRELLNPQSKTSSRPIHWMFKYSAPMQCSLSCSEPSCAKLGFIPTISTPTWCMQWEPTSWRTKGICEVPVAYFILDTVLALSETLPCPRWWCPSTGLKYL